ncbi:MAG: transposase [Christensenellaceae bacterium]|nr:transposase [Christensenellaceae bacterium]
MATASYPRFYRGRKKNSQELRKLSRERKAARICKAEAKSGTSASISNQLKDFLHKQSRRIERCDAVSIEDLNMRGMA